MAELNSGKPERRIRYVRAVDERLRRVLYVVLGLFALLGANSAYLGGITLLEWWSGLTYQNYFYQIMFLGHLVLGLLIAVPFFYFAVKHLFKAWGRPNKRAARVGALLFLVGTILIFSGFVLTRLEGFEVKDPNIRRISYWAHVISPFAVIWLYLLHRLAGPKIKWRIGFSWGVIVVVAAGAMVLLHSQDPRQWNKVGPEEGTQYFQPSLIRTADGNFIPAKSLMMDAYCQECHADAHEGWSESAHRFSSFNNPPYLFSVRETRQMALKRDGNVKAARWCAGCHDVVPFLSGAFDDPEFDDVNDITAHAGITCTVCHAITHINSTRGNADYTIEEPSHYPFAFSDNPVLSYINRQLVKAKPDFHKKTFLKPLHRTAEFCSVCHKVSLPKELNHYKDFLRGQNHYDNFLLSGVSGQNARAFYYPQKAQTNCNLCHMPLKSSDDFGADYFNPDSDERSIHDHLFLGANTGLPHLRGNLETVEAHQEFLKDCLRVDLFGIREQGTIDGKLIAPLRPEIPELQPGKTYLLEVVVRTLTLGHIFTQGTADSNQVWVNVKMIQGDNVIGSSGELQDRNIVDPWSHFINVYMLDREGNRIDRRNAQDIFTPLYNHQIPPGAAQVIHYSFTVPEGSTAPIRFEASVKYRKFDTTYMEYVQDDSNYVNDLPITVLDDDQITFPVTGSAFVPEKEEIAFPLWQRWNDYGIGLLLKGSEGSEKGELIQAEQSFKEVEKLGRVDGPINLARVYEKEGRLAEAVEALTRAQSGFDPPARRWTVAWFTGRVNKQHGYLDKAITEFQSIIEDRYPELERRGFDFSKDYVVLNELGQTLFERSKQERRNPEARTKYLESAVKRFLQVLDLDSENLTAHYNLGLIYSQLERSEDSKRHRELHEKYRPDVSAREQAKTAARLRDPAANHAAQSVVIYPLTGDPAKRSTVTVDQVDRD